MKYTPVRTFPSRSSSKTYTVSRDEKGRLSCNCPAWTFKHGEVRTCKHIQKIEKEELLGKVQQMATPKPIASFGLAVTGLVATFANNSQGAERFVWDFGDGLQDHYRVGDPGAFTPFKHTYHLPGSYTVMLTASNGSASDVYRRDVLVAELAPLTMPEADRPGTFNLAAALGLKLKGKEV